MNGSGVTAEPTLVVEPDGIISFADTAAQSLLAADTGKDIVGSSITEYTSSPYHTSLIEQLQRIHSGDASSMGLRIELNVASGESREFIAVSTPVDWNGSEQIQLLLIETDDQLPSGLSAETMDESPIGISIADATREDEPLIYVNDGFCELTGYEREEILGRNCRFLQGEETDEAIVADIRQAIDAEEPITTELRNYRKDGSLFWNRLTITPIEDETGTVTHFLGFQETYPTASSTNKRKHSSNYRLRRLNSRSSSPTQRERSSTSTLTSSERRATQPTRRSEKIHDF